jgi:hypothetical protein
MEEYPETGELPEFHLLANTLSHEQAEEHNGNDPDVLNF